MNSKQILMKKIINDEIFAIYPINRVEDVNGLSIALEEMAESIQSNNTMIESHISDTIKHITSNEKNLLSTISNKADLNHNHNNLYLSLTGGTITNNLEVNGNVSLHSDLNMNNTNINNVKSLNGKNIEDLIANDISSCYKIQPVGISIDTNPITLSNGIYTVEGDVSADNGFPVTCWDHATIYVSGYHGTDDNKGYRVIRYVSAWYDTRGEYIKTQWDTDNWTNWIKIGGEFNTKTLKNPTSTTHSNWSGNDTTGNIVPTMNMFAYWNGAYNSENKSNLAYCNKGEFHSMATKSASNYLQYKGVVSDLAKVHETCFCTYNGDTLNTPLKAGLTQSGAGFCIVNHEAGNSYETITIYPCGDNRVFTNTCSNEVMGSWKVSDEASKVNGVTLHPGNQGVVDSNNQPWVYAFNGGDDCNCYVKNMANMKSGDSDKLNGQSSSYYATSNHNHYGGIIDPGGIELGRNMSGHGGYIDFHYNNSSADYTSRIIEISSGIINVMADRLRVNGNDILLSESGIIRTYNGYSSTGSSYLNMSINGIKLKIMYGRVNTESKSIQTIVFPSTFTGVPMVFIEESYPTGNNTQGISIKSKSNSNFSIQRNRRTYYTDSVGEEFYYIDWFAIGV